MVNYERSKKTRKPLLFYYGKENREKLEELSQYLYDHKTITGDEFMQILNRREYHDEV